MSLEDHVAEVLRAVPPRTRGDVCMLGVWVTAQGSAVIGWNTSSFNGAAWEWNQWRFACPIARVVEHAPPPERIEQLLCEMHRDGRIAAALGHAVGFIVDGELAPCSA
ncbi:hypothetical protein [Solirubrobacter soli]|uniref:hypothetical protein n=1 Tax=Solirubrobacter soli TaxID=363832 RepID=UPI0003FB25F7|nr:hypothetical protein [Solirubrobacter soli]